MSTDDRVSQIEAELKALSQKRKTLISELRSIDKVEKTPSYGTCSNLPFSTPEERIDLFLNHFRCRKDVYPRFWQNNRSGKKGYSPVCQNEWANGICKKPKKKCGDCNYQSFKPFNKDTALDHLQGKEIVGTYTAELREIAGTSCVALPAF